MLGVVAAPAQFDGRSARFSQSDGGAAPADDCAIDAQPTRMVPADRNRLELNLTPTATTDWHSGRLGPSGLLRVGEAGPGTNQRTG